MWNLEMAELAEDMFSGANRCLVVCQLGKRSECAIAVVAGIRLVEHGIVFGMTKSRVPMKRVVRAVPVILERFRALLKDLTATLWTNYVVPQAKVLVQEQASFRDPLVTILALYIARVRWNTVRCGRILRGILLGIERYRANLIVLGRFRRRCILRGIGVDRNPQRFGVFQLHIGRS